MRLGVKDGMGQKTIVWKMKLTNFSKKKKKRKFQGFEFELRLD